LRGQLRRATSPRPGNRDDAKLQLQLRLTLGSIGTLAQPHPRAVGQRPLPGNRAHSREGDAEIAEQAEKVRAPARL